MKIELDNAQSGGPQITVTKKGVVIGHIYPRGGNEKMIYWDFGKETKTLAEMPTQDGILIYSDEEESRR